MLVEEKKNNNATVEVETITVVSNDLHMPEEYDFSLGNYTITDQEKQEKFICSICQCLMNSASETPCGHLFCEGCIKKWLQEKNCCATCKSDIPIKGPQYHKSTFVQREIDNMEITCNFCNWKGSVVDYRRTHSQEQVDIKKRCPKMIGKCKKCKKQRRGVEHDRNECEYRKISCDKCKTSIVAIELKEHLETDCPKVKVDCDSKQCTWKGRRHKKQSHLMECLLIEITCPFAQYGCTHKSTRKEMDKHVSENLERHFTIACDLIEQLQSKVRAFEMYEKNLQEHEFSIGEKVLYVPRNSRSHTHEIGTIKDIDYPDSDEDDDQPLNLLIVGGPSDEGRWYQESEVKFMA